MEDEVRARGSSAPVDVAPVRDPDHVYPPLLVVHPIDRPPLAHADAVALATAQLLAP